MSAYVFVSVAGGSLGLLAGGILTQALSWHWVFFVNLPIGLATFVLGQRFIRADSGLGLEHGVDWLGSILVTASLMGVIYAIVQATTHGWISTQVLGFGAHRRTADGGVRRARGPHREPDHADAHPAPPGAGQGQPRQRLPGDRDVLDVLPRKPLSRARPPLQRRADRRRVPALDDHGRRPVAGRSPRGSSIGSGRFACSPRAWRARSSACSCSAPSDRAPPSSPRSSSPASRSASASAARSCPCSPSPWPTFPPLTRASAPGSPTSPSRSAARSAWPSSARSPRTGRRDCYPPTRGLTSSLIGGYHLAFLVGAATITAGIVLAFALLRPRRCSPGCNWPTLPAADRRHSHQPRHRERSRMTHTDRLPAHTTASNREGRRSPHAPLQSGRRRPSIRLISDAVVASYIHDISERHRDGVPASEARSRRPAHHA